MKAANPGLCSFYNNDRIKKPGAALRSACVCFPVNFFPYPMPLEKECCFQGEHECADHFQIHQGF